MIEKYQARANNRKAVLELGDQLRQFSIQICLVNHSFDMFFQSSYNI